MYEAFRHLNHRNENADFVNFMNKIKKLNRNAACIFGVLAIVLLVTSAIMSLSIDSIILLACGVSLIVSSIRLFSESL